MAELKKFSLKDETTWNDCVAKNADDAYGARINEFAADWANLMEAEMAAGKKLVDIAEECGRKANYDGITGFMYGCAVSILSKVWVHGEGFRRWHNRETQVGDEGYRANESGGVLNPAIMVLKVPE